jgi:hypothetical protein
MADKKSVLFPLLGLIFIIAIIALCVASIQPVSVP